jgi:hypothetical protein
MRCLTCNAEMHVEQVTPDETSPVLGYEHRILRCPECGDVERRLTFAGDRSAPVAGSAIGNETIGSPVSPPIADTQPETAQSETQAAPQDKVPAAKWAQAVEKVRMRHTVLARQVAAQRTADPVVGRSHDFDRIWENRLSPGQSRPSFKEASPPRLAPAPAVQASPSPAPRVVTLSPVAPATSEASVAGVKPVTTAKPHPFQSAWTRALALIRQRQERVAQERLAKVETPDAILRIDTDALRVMPRNRPAAKASPGPGRPR